MQRSLRRGSPPPVDWDIARYYHWYFPLVWVDSTMFAALEGRKIRMRKNCGAVDALVPQASTLQYYMLLLELREYRALKVD